jgi:recombination protein RecT
MTAATGKAVSIIEQFSNSLDKLDLRALPSQIPVERFKRTILWYVQNNPALFKCSQYSLLMACSKAAIDGLLPDGREGTIIPFADDDGRKSDKAVWMPMIAGIRKKARNSAEIADWYQELVHANDDFSYELGDDPHIRHRPELNGPRGPVIYAYSICKFKDGTIAREVMSAAEIDDVRKKYSRAGRSGKGPWHDAYGEMARKTVAHRHAKRLPLSSDLDAVLRHDLELYNFKEEHSRESPRRQPRNALAALDRFAGNGGDSPQDDPPLRDDAADPRQGDDVVIEGGPAPPAAIIAAMLAQAEATPPQTAGEVEQLVTALLGHAGGEPESFAMIRTWWTSPSTRALRNRANITVDESAAIAARIKKAIEAGAGGGA